MKNSHRFESLAARISRVDIFFPLERSLTPACAKFAREHFGDTLHGKSLSESSKRNSRVGIYGDCLKETKCGNPFAESVN